MFVMLGETEYFLESVCGIWRAVLLVPLSELGFQDHTVNVVERMPFRLHMKL